MVPTLPLDQGCDDIQVMASVAVGQRRPEDIVIAFGEEVAALVHLHEGVAALHGVQRASSYRAGTPFARPSS